MDDAIECMKMAVRRKNKNVVVDAFGEAPPAGIEKLEAAKRDTLSAQEVSDLLPPFVSALYRAWGTRPTACIENKWRDREKSSAHAKHPDCSRTPPHAGRNRRTNLARMLEHRRTVVTLVACSAHTGIL